MVTDRYRTLAARFDRHDLHRIECEGGLELVDGLLVQKPVSIESCQIETTVATLLWAAAARLETTDVFDSGMGYMCFGSDPCRVRKPSVSIVRTERMAAVDPQDPFLTFPPDLAVEVLSGRERPADVHHRVEEYLSNGFPLVWVVYPSTRSVTAHRADGSTAEYRGQDEITGEAALPGFNCPVADFFGTAR